MAGEGSPHLYEVPEPGGAGGCRGVARAGHRHLEAAPGSQAALHRGQEVSQLLLPQHYTLELSTNLREVSLTV